MEHTRVAWHRRSGSYNSAAEGSLRHGEGGGGYNLIRLPFGLIFE